VLETPAVLLLDNFDSFTDNLADEFARRGAPVTVLTNALPLEVVDAAIGSHDLLVISPGPGAPADAGCTVPLVERCLGRIPIFGVCLGHQALVAAAGGQVERAPTPIHGRAVPLTHDGSAPFEGLPNPMPVGRYHSLGATRLPPALAAIAHADGVVMAVSHRVHPALGVQFHPESILTPSGGPLFDNLIAWVRRVGR